MDQNNQTNEPTPTNPTQPEIQPVVTPEPSSQQPYTQPEQQQPQAPSPVQPVAAQQTNIPTHNPGETLGIISIIMTVPLGLSLVGLILGILSRKRSQEAGASTTLGSVGIVLGAIGTILVTLILLSISIVAYNGIQERSNSNDYNNSSSSTL